MRIRGLNRLCILGVVSIVVVACRPTPIPVEESVSNQYFHKYGFSLSQDEWQSRGSTGKVISHQKNGVIRTVEYSDGLKDGVAETSYPYSKTIAKTELYEKGQLISEKEHYESGAPRREVTYSSEGKRELSAWYETGSPQAIEEYFNESLITAQYFTKENEVEAGVEESDGTRIVRDKLGVIAQKETIESGKATLRETYGSDGTLKTVETFKEGKLHGTSKEYGSSNQLLTECQWFDGIKEGLSLYFKEGELIAEVPYKLGLKEGLEKRYRASDLIETLTWVSDKKHGAHKIFVGGKEVKTEYYYHDIPVSQGAFERMVLQ